MRIIREKSLRNLSVDVFKFRGARRIVRPYIRYLSVSVFLSFALSLKHSRLVLGSTFLLCIFFNFKIANMPHFFTMEDTLDSRLPSVSATKNAEMKFQSGVPLQIFFYMKDYSEIPTVALCRIKSWLESDVYSIPHLSPLSQVMSPFEVRRSKVEGDRVWFPKLVHLDCGQVGLRIQTSDMDSRLQLFSEQKSDIVRTNSEISTLLENTPWRGILTPIKGYSDFYAELNFAATDWNRNLLFNSNTALAVDHSLAKALSHFSNLSWHLGGPAAFRAYSKQASEKDLLINTLIPIVLFILYRIFFGSWMGGLLLAISLFVVRSMLLGVMAVLGYSADPVTGCLITLVSLSAVADFLFVSNYQLNHGAGWKQSYKRFLIPSLLTSLTTAIGFASLMTSDITTVHDLGMWATVGCMLQWWTIYFVLPAINSVFPCTRIFAIPSHKVRISRLGSLGRRILPLKSKYLIYILMTFSMVSIPFIETEDSLDRFFPKAHKFSQSLTYMRESRNWESEMGLTLSQNTTDSEKAALYSALKQSPWVERIDSGDQFLTYLRKDLETLDQDLVLRLASTDDIFRRYFASDGSEMWHLFLRTNSLKLVEEIAQMTQNICDRTKCQLTGALPIFVDFSKEVVNSLFKSFGLSLLLVSLFLLFYMWWNEFTDYIPILVSALFGPIVMMGFLVWFHVPINFVSFFIAAILVGLAGDNAIQFIYSAKGGRLSSGIDSCASSSILICVNMISISLLLLFSSFLPPQTLAVVLALGLVVNLFGDLWVLKLMLKTR